MSLFCNTKNCNYVNNCQQSTCECSAQTNCCCEQTTQVESATSCNCSCECTDQSTAVAGETTTEAPQTVRALLNTVIDSCCTTDDVCREITFCIADDSFANLEVGTAFNVTINGPLTFSEVTRSKDGCVCVSTIRYNIPIRIHINDNNCGCGGGCIDKNITVIRSVRLCCTANSTLTTHNSQVVAASAVVSDICNNQVTLTVCLLFRSCLQQTVIREYSWEATPVCVSPNCMDARNSLLDPCDTICGCTAGFSCPSC